MNPPTQPSVRNNCCCGGGRICPSHGDTTPEERKPDAMTPTQPSATHETPVEAGMRALFEQRNPSATPRTDSFLKRPDTAWDGMWIEHARTLETELVSARAQISELNRLRELDKVLTKELHAKEERARKSEQELADAQSETVEIQHLLNECEISDFPQVEGVRKLAAQFSAAKAECERLKAMGSWAHTCVHHTDKERVDAVRCPCCSTAELTLLRAEVAKFSEPNALHAHCVRTLTDSQVMHLFGERSTEITNERDSLRAENERLKNQRDNLLKPSREKAIDRAERAEAESAGRLKTLNEKADELRAEWINRENAEAQLALKNSQCERAEQAAAAAELALSAAYAEIRKHKGTIGAVFDRDVWDRAARAAKQAN